MPVLYDIVLGNEFAKYITSMPMAPEKGISVHFNASSPGGSDMVQPQDVRTVFSIEEMEALVSEAHEAGQTVVTVRAFFEDDARSVHAIGHAHRGDEGIIFPEPFRQIRADGRAATSWEDSVTKR